MQFPTLESLILTSHDPDNRPDVTTSAGGLVAVTAEIATSPTSVNDMVDVTVAHLDGGTSRVGPSRWMPRVNDAGAVVYPNRGDWALVIFDQDGDATVAVWWPQ